MNLISILAIFALLQPSLALALASRNPYLDQSILDSSPQALSHDVDGEPGNHEVLPHKYRAKLHCSSSTTSIVPGEYIVTLALGHTILLHSAAIEEDMWLRVATVDDSPYMTKTTYLIKNTSVNLLERIRSDKGVESVKCNNLIKPVKSDPLVLETMPINLSLIWPK